MDFTDSDVEADIEELVANPRAVRMMASVARVYEPGHKFDYATVLQGAQGIRKVYRVRGVPAAQVAHPSVFG